MKIKRPSISVIYVVSDNIQQRASIRVFDYQDYREFLKDWYVTHKAQDKKISFRYLARRAGFRAPNFFKLVMEGNRNIGEDSLHRICDALKLDETERDYFKSLVLKNQKNLGL